ncbi:MAG: right-handed parallel beta-helix repeat-containing protein [Planctomycetes bacterium]|nr:right-handed parallel beta-helix repeat-containing protein [Planctomycetota bacterium]MCH9724575.1 right-handed parallel beta-helix repeat-containing protein [Planctomycetota bacterium]MCH9777863.1 right-handed parallel beta-helix repeat-containing protein [Planctomycetota bacterium]MCH9793038.1 right-handed parallel beta-helix repeat-containing protein [Planctomycetota bacterium]
MCSISSHRPSNVCRLHLLGLLSLFIPLLAITPLAANTLRVPADHKTIQAAVDAATNGDTILVSAGSYKERIHLKEGVTLKSDGDETKGKLGLKRAETTIIDGGGNQGEGAGVLMAERATLDGFTVTNIGVYDDAKWNKHHATHGEQQSHEHIGEPGTAGIAVMGATCIIKNNIVHHIGYTGIAIQRTTDDKPCTPHVYRNICYRNMGGGIGSMRKSTAVIEENICFQNFYAGIGHDDASPTVINNICYENIRSGIGISEGSCAFVRGNKCYNNRRAGIGVRTYASTQPLLEDNDCYENDMAGIGASEKSAPIIRNNRCYKNKLTGIGAQSHATPTIIGNECYENGRSGIGQQGDAVTILINNHCHHNKASGLGFAPCKSGRSTVINNRIIDNGKIAVGINPGWTVQLSGNELARKGGMPPILMVFKGSEAILTNNVIRGGGVAGIRVTGKVRAENNEFVGTALRKIGPPNFAIWALPGSDIMLNGNKIQGWRHALQANGATVFATRNQISKFHGAAFVIQQPTSPANVFGNTAISNNPKDQVLKLDGEAGIVNNNNLKPTTD